MSSENFTDTTEYTGRVKMSKTNSRNTKRKPVNNSEFVEWLQKEMDAHKWSQADLAREAGISRGAVSNLMRSERNPGKLTLRAIAKALNYPPEVAYQKAGFLDTKTKASQYIERIGWLAEQLPTREQEEIIEILELKVRRRKEIDLVVEFADEYLTLPPKEAAAAMRRLLQTLGIVEKGRGSD